MYLKYFLNVFVFVFKYIEKLEVFVFKYFNKYLTPNLIWLYLEHLVPLLKLDINILSILHYLGSPLGCARFIWPHEELINL